jgi:hypothetical protein
MSRTYRRRGQRHEYYWVLFDLRPGAPPDAKLDPRSPEGRRATARYHSDKEVTLGGAAPRWYRKVFDHRLRTFNDKQLGRWLTDPEYEPVMEVRHRHNANWSWW